MDRMPRPQDISWFLDLNQRKQLDLDPPYQRKSVWTRGDRQYFLDTIFHNYPCPAVFLHKSMSDAGETMYHVVDGKQRLQTILDFVGNELAISKSYGDERLAGKKWKQLDVDAKKAFWNYLITVEMLPSVNDAVVNSVFERINRNARKLMRQELRHAKFDGWFITRAEAEAEKNEWRTFGVVTAARAKRMSDVQFISELMIVTIGAEIVGFDQDAIDQWYADYDVPSETRPNFVEEQFNSTFEKTKLRIGKMGELQGEVLQYTRTFSHFYSLWAYLILIDSDDIDLAGAAKRYVDFMHQVSNVLEREDDDADGGSSDHTGAADSSVMKYARHVRGASTDAMPRRMRHEALVAAIGV